MGDSLDWLYDDIQGMVRLHMVVGMIKGMDLKPDEQYDALVQFVRMYPDAFEGSNIDG